MAESLTLKWGSVKAGAISGEIARDLARYFADGVPLSAMADKPTEERREVLCELIDQFTGEIWNDWDGVVMNKDDAKKAFGEYGRKAA